MIISAAFVTIAFLWLLQFNDHEPLKALQLLAIRIVAFCQLDLSRFHERFSAAHAILMMTVHMANQEIRSLISTKPDYFD